MIVLAVISYNGQATEPAEASFDEMGGTIGRADGNLMVLPDPERTISRVHAKVVFRNGRYAIEDRGSNPILVNGNVVGNGKVWPLAPGDVVLIGGYELGVRASDAPQVADDPFADMFGSPAATLPGTAPPAPVVTAPAVAARRAPPPAAPALGAIPSDWNPLAEDKPSSAGGLLGAEPDPGDLVGQGAVDESIDDLFGLGGKAGKAAAAGAEAWPEDDDFLGLFDPARPASGGAGEPQHRLRREDAGLEHQRGELGVAFPNVPHVAHVSSAPAAPAAVPAPVTARAAPTPASAPAPLAAPGAGRRVAPVVSWDGGARQATIVAPATGARRPGNGSANPAMATNSGIRPGARSAAPAAAAPVAGAGSDELLRALLEGLGVVQAPAITTLTPELMRLMGALLAESISGVVGLLQARAAIKREVRAEVTAIRPRQNNPLKFSPTAALALQHLLGPSVPGFMRGEEAVRDAYGDLRAHELAVMAGMRAALAGLLQRFDPQVLEGRLEGRSGLGMLLAGGRRAQLWETYQQLYVQLSAEAEDDFHAVFGRAFLQAYQEQLDRLGNEGNTRGG
ncbi:type VI secretion system-associated FHA domain protein TagH [Pseudorhodoferax sp.]|uniref:type VI secretion system-associated FHA domain protein TagH n=1 Tax=Pseudorhodoferax sp. TaxID=1993553 RepID=UPI002DD66E51|nr:type VI secretion system-associated FHA domain protein TagH [Pseudorhodoferax sp.]